ncbi:MAG: hypothetical protein COB53_04170 [Elusimicrobia bacterium]|nr:MAG: hypothetical protein COB53_04170 [Elusimicrobiota bacterium]
MSVYLKCVFKADDEKMAKFQQTEMLERLTLVIADEAVKINPLSLAENASEAGTWDIHWEFSASIADEDHVSKQVRDAVGSPWDTASDGETRYRSPGTGGYSDAFSLCRSAEVSVKRSFLKNLFG